MTAESGEPARLRAPAARPVVIDGPAGAIEALVDAPAGAPRALAIVCHPHPLHQGTMHNKVAHTLARTFRNLGAVAVRFNFRGVGASAGRHADGEGEREDVAAVAAWGREQWPGLELLLGGFSFGAAMAYLSAGPLEARALVTAALPVERVGAAAPPACPWLTVHGALDDIVPIAALERWLAAIVPQPELVVFPEADHFFHGHLPQLAERVSGMLEARVPDLVEASDAAGAD